MPQETSDQSLLLALQAGYCTVYFGINTSKQEQCRQSSLEGKSFVQQYLSITYLAGALGLEPRWTCVVGVGDRCNRRYATPLYKQHLYSINLLQQVVLCEIYTVYRCS